jgi:hypothetical protein
MYQIMCQTYCRVKNKSVLTYQLFSGQDKRPHFCERYNISGLLGGKVEYFFYLSNPVSSN